MELNLTEHRILRDGYRLYAHEHAGTDPAIILLPLVLAAIVMFVSAVLAFLFLPDQVKRTPDIN